MPFSSASVCCLHIRKFENAGHVFDDEYYEPTYSERMISEMSFTVHLSLVFSEVLGFEILIIVGKPL
ncbi:hypothetical protein L6452_21133 [Arctium lappa]|uniref:Uncharacterized protein n=1 Tax=Arctium lappa TaxID=4217 RepID=A0ACB9BHR4_ARCLA|nr:hypothetical protein L6452_21133 [Arctium lappa]